MSENPLTVSADYLYNLSADGDEWGNVMSHWFGIAHALYVEGHPVPYHWQFRPGMGLTPGTELEDWPDAEYQTMLQEGEVTAEALVSFVKDTLIPESKRLKSEGKDY